MGVREEGFSPNQPPTIYLTVVINLSQWSESQTLLTDWIAKLWKELKLQRNIDSDKNNELRKIQAE